MSAAPPESTRGIPSPQNLLLRGKRKTLSGLDPVSTSLTTPCDIAGTVPDLNQDAGRGLLCDHCGCPDRDADPLNPWNWPGWPDGIWLHTRCEAPWHDQETGRCT
jgi:hypothetical protein